MKLSLRKILNSTSSISKLNEVELPIKISFRLSLLSKNLDYILKIYSDKLNIIFEKYGEKIDNEQIKIKHDNVELFTKEKNELEDEEVDVDVQEIKISEIESIKISAKDMMLLDWLIKE